MTERGKLTVLDLYCGLGGLSLGFEMTGSFSSLGGIDNYAPAVATFYSHSARRCKLIGSPQDISQLEPLAVLDGLGEKPDIVVGGPPCQGFSHAGRRLDEFDSDQRNAQVFHFLRFVAALRPKAFLMENVSGILSTGQERKFELLDTLLARYRDLGYVVSHKVLNTVDFRVPQNRKRLILIGVLEPKLEFVFPQPACLGDGAGLGLFESPYTVAGALSDLPSPIQEEPQDYESPPQTSLQSFLRRDSTSLFNHSLTKHSAQMLEKLNRQKQGTRLYPNWNHSWYRLDPNRPSPAVKENHRAPFVHYREPRATSPRECARLQTIPDRVRLAGTKTNQLIMVGNAVPAIFAAHLATSLAKQAFGLAVAVPWTADRSPLSPPRGSSTAVRGSVHSLQRTGG